jgi:hypothetical protein
MKRREMLNEMVKIISNQYFDPEVEAKDLLDRMEELGMLPPGGEVSYALIDGTKLGKGFVCRWEPEDEKE